MADHAKEYRKAVKEGHLEKAKELIAQGVDGKQFIDELPHKPKYAKMNALHWAALHGNLKFAQFLKENNLWDVNSIGSNERTPLHCLAEGDGETSGSLNDRIALAELFVNDPSIKSNTKDDDGNTALHLLMFGNTHISQDDVIKLATVIQKANPNVDQRNTDGITAAELAKRVHWYQVATFLNSSSKEPQVPAKQHAFVLKPAVIHDPTPPPPTASISTGGMEKLLTSIGVPTAMTSPREVMMPSEPWKQPSPRG